MSQTTGALTARDRQRLEGVHADLVRVVEAARQKVPFIVVEGLRTRERQQQLVSKGASQTMNSRHLTGHAVDLAPTLDGDVRWDWPLFYPMAAAMQDAANALGVAIVWGGTWPKFKDGPHLAHRLMRLRRRQVLNAGQRVNLAAQAIQHGWEHNH